MNRPAVQLDLVRPAVEVGSLFLFGDGTRHLITELLPDGAVRLRTSGYGYALIGASGVREAVRTGRILPPKATDDQVDAALAALRAP